MVWPTYHDLVSYFPSFSEEYQWFDGKISKVKGKNGLESIRFCNYQFLQIMFSKTILEMNDALWSSRVIFTFGHSTDEWTLAILRTTMGPKSLWICKLWIQIWPDNYFSPIMRTIGHRHHHVPSKVSGSQICRGLMTNWTTFLGCPVALPYGEVRLKMNSVPRF